MLSDLAPRRTASMSAADNVVIPLCGYLQKEKSGAWAFTRAPASIVFCTFSGLTTFLFVPASFFAIGSKWVKRWFVVVHKDDGPYLQYFSDADDEIAKKVYGDFWFSSSPPPSLVIGVCGLLSPTFAQPERQRASQHDI